MRWLTACALVAACSDPPAEPRVVRTERALDGMPIYHRAKRSLVRGDGSVVMTTGRALDPRTPRTPAIFVDDEAGAIRRAAAGARVTQARARQFWYPYADQLIAAWVVEAYTSDPHTTTGDLVRTVISGDGRVLSRESLVADAAFTYTVFAEPGGEKHPFDSPLADITPHPTSAPDGSFPVYVSPQEVTVDSGLNTLADPWLAGGAVATTGNNVDAYADTVAPTGLGDGDFRASASGSSFSYVYDVNEGPLATPQQQMAAITSLFYVINWLHDFWYDAGFTEAAGNAQASNYGRGGLEGDVMLAEAQDNALGGSRNNANMSTPADGMSPRMQVYLWTGKQSRSMTVSPGGRAPLIGTSSFGPRSYAVTAPIVLAQDGTGASPTDGCTPLTNGADAAGKLVLFDRGNCTYKTKTTNAQAAGAVGAIIADNVAAALPPTMGDDPNLADPAIPTVSVLHTEGVTLKSELGAGAVTATIQRTLAADLDGSLDSTLIAHEFGHYLHHRLSECNGAMCRAMSEGWGDFTSLLLLARPGDDLRGAFPFSVYTTQGYAGDPAYFGIRRAPYSVNFDINALMFRHMSNGVALPTHPLQPQSNNSEVHNAGEIWAAALWEVYVALHESAPSPSFLDIRSKMARYIVNGLSLVAEEASPLEMRDALLAAALAESPADYTVMALAFARRGFGSCAVAPPRGSVTFVGIVDSTSIAGNAQMSSLEIADGCDDDSILDTGETATVKVQVVNQGHAPLTDVNVSITSEVPGVTVLTPPTQLGRLESFETRNLEISVSLEAGVVDALAGDLALQVTSSGGCEETVKLPVAFRLNIDDVRAASATDTFDAVASFWEPWAIAWRHERATPLNGIWHADDLSIASDTRLTSPRLVADAEQPLTISFSHRYSFEVTNDTNWDGAVLEYSVDDGETWGDISELADPGYTAIITNESGNELGDRPGYTGKNAAYPEYETVTLALGTALAGKTFRFRFRLGTDAGTGAPGWDIDEIAFDGIVGTPFPSQVADDGVCPPDPIDDPILSGGGGCCQTGGSSSDSAFLALAVLGLLGRRRARARDRSRSRA